MPPPQSALLLLLTLSSLLPLPSLAIRSFPTLLIPSPIFSEAPAYRNADHCPVTPPSAAASCHPSLVHIAMTLDHAYLRGSIAAVHSILKHASCPDNIFFHFLSSGPAADLHSTFPSLHFKVYPFEEKLVGRLISPSVRPALETPLNYARNHLAGILPPCIHRVVYLDSDLLVVDDVRKLWDDTRSSPAVIAAPEYCRANFTKYFTPRFWSDPRFASTFDGRRQPCYFNTGVMVMNLARWRRGGYTRRIERWMEVQKEEEGRIYELGSLPPFLLEFAGLVAPIEHRWNQHGLGGDNVMGSCRELHPGPVSLLHWSGKGKPWARLDAGNPCPLDHLWAPYDLYKGSSSPHAKAL